MKHETQCVYVFEINYRRCKACSGQDKTCRCYTPRGAAQAKPAPKPEQKSK